MKVKLRWLHAPLRTGMGTGELKDFDTFAEAVRFAMRDMPETCRDSAIIESEGKILSFAEIKAAYEAPDFPRD